MRKIIKFIILVAVLCFCHEQVGVEASTGYVFDDTTLVGYTGKSGTIIVPDSATAVNLVLSDFQGEKFVCGDQVESCIITFNNCSFNQVEIEGTEVDADFRDCSIVTLAVAGGDASESTVDYSGSLTSLTVDTETTRVVVDSDSVGNVSFGDTVIDANLSGNWKNSKLNIGCLGIGSSIESLIIYGVDKIIGVENKSSYIEVNSGLLYNNLEYDDYECNGSDVTGSDYALIYYPLAKKEISGLSSKCTMIAEDVFTGHSFDENNVTIPSSIRIVGEQAFSQLPESTSITVPDSVEFISRAVASGSSVTINFDGSSNVVCDPEIFNGATIKSLSIPDGLTFEYYDCDDTTLAEMLKGSLTSTTTVNISESAKSRSVFDTAGFLGTATNNLKKPTNITCLKTSRGYKFGWKKIKTAERYELQVSLKRTFKDATVVRCRSNFGYVSNLKKGKTYYVRVRIINEDATGKWSSVVKFSL